MLGRWIAGRGGVGCNMDSLGDPIEGVAVRRKEQEIERAPWCIGNRHRAAPRTNDGPSGGVLHSWSLGLGIL